MRRRPAPEPVSARALARLRGSRGTGWVPSPRGLGLGSSADLGPSARDDPVPAEPDGPGPVPGRHRRVEAARRWVRAPVAVVGARWQPGRAAVLGVVLVTAVAVLVLGLRVAWAHDATGDVVAPPDAATGTLGVSRADRSVGLPSEAPDAGPAPPSPTSSPGAEVVVHVVGEVAHPGVRRLPAGSRVQDAVDAAGGPTRRADLGGINLARVLVDGEQVRVPRPGEVVPAGPSTSGATSGEGGAPVSLGTADVATLDTLPGIGPVLAQRIVDWRTENGGFSSVDELAEVSGIGEKMLADLRPLVVP